MTAAADPSERYLALALRFGTVQPDLFDSYCGPAELEAQVAAEAPSSYERLAEETAALAAEVEPGPLLGDVTALETVCRWFAGEQIAFTELVRRCHQIEAELVPEQAFADAHARLDAVLPGRGPLNERFVAWRESQEVPAEQVGAGLELLASELRARTDALFGLPDGEDVEFALVTGKPWGGNCDYLGNGRTRISINLDVPIPSYRLLELVTHEVYPGHHTDHVHREPLIAAGQLELAIALFPTPRSVVAEGIAMLAHEILLGDGAERVGAEILSSLGIAYDADTAAAVRATQEVLTSVGPNLVQMLAEGRIAPDDARPYARRWLLGPEKLLDRSVALLDWPWPAYALCYPTGLALVRRFVNGDPKRFRRLLDEQLTPGDLAA